MKQFSDETQKIIDNHKRDFNCIDFAKKIKSKGGYNAYVKSLGGVFSKYLHFNSKVQTVEQFQKIGEYVYGLIAIWGFDYHSSQKYVRWGGPAPFYVNGKKGKSNRGKIDELCNGKKDPTTTCAYSIESLLLKAGLMGGSGQISKTWDYEDQILNHKGKIIRKKKDLRPGDLIHYFKSTASGSNPKKWKNWYHMAIVSSVTDENIYVYDTGSSAIKEGIHKKQYSRKSGNQLSSNAKDWVGVRLYDLKYYDTKKSAADLAVEAIRGKCGSNSFRKVYLGKKYDEVQDLVNKYIKSESKYLIAAADYALKGYLKTKEDKKKFFGSDYEKVKKKIQWTQKTAKDVIKGKYGTKEVRKKNLGINYHLVQNEVNRIISK